MRWLDVTPAASAVSDAEFGTVITTRMAQQKSDGHNTIGEWASQAGNFHWQW
ncbi:MAG TPA: hypothetical protein VF456_09595 [Vicinamibacterales bacterium]